MKSDAIRSKKLRADLQCAQKDWRINVLVIRYLIIGFFYMILEENEHTSAGVQLNTARVS